MNSGFGMNERRKRDNSNSQVLQYGNQKRDYCEEHAYWSLWCMYVYSVITELICGALVGRRVSQNTSKSRKR